MQPITTREQFGRWQMEARQVTTVLDRIERDARAILKDIGCPTTPTGVYAILNGEAPAPWPKRTAERDKRRARYALHAIVHARTVRRYLGPDRDSENPRLAAYAAVMAGAYAGDVVIAADDAKLGAAHRAQQRDRSRRGVQTKRDEHSRSDAVLRREVDAIRRVNPGIKVRALARELLSRFGRSYDGREQKRNAIEALRKRIARLPKKG
jgi:hypothetical protein